MSLLREKRVILIGVITILIATGFWSSSRYPQLQGKAEMTGQISLQDTLTHDAHVEIAEDAPIYKQVAATTVNWAWTNRQGMTFAVFLAACFLTLFNYLPAFKTQNKFINSFYGMLTGTPLGVCVNCVAPITKALYESGRSAQMALAVMFSSPTLNIIVLTMLFAFFPFYIAALKLFFTFIIILAIVPFLSHERQQKIKNDEIGSVCDINTDFLKTNEDWVKALKGASIDYFKSFKYIVIRTVPLMFVAGFLGALMTHIWDPNTLIGQSPSIISIFGVAVFGTFLPMPIAFDVMTAQALFAANVPIVVVVTLLFTLGIFSVYSFFIVWRTFSIKLAIELYLIVCVVGMACGYTAQYYSDYKAEIRAQRYKELVIDSPDKTTLPTTLIQANAYIELSGLEDITTPESKRVLDDKNLKIDRILHKERNKGDKPFTMMKAEEVGIDSYNELNAANFIEPFLLGRSVASGDFNKDGWMDFAAATKGGVDLYQNINGEEFKKVELEIPGFESKEAVNVALVDMNNDSWPDFYITTFAEGNYIILNPLGKKENKNLIHLTNKKSLLTHSLSFADIDLDGNLDVAHGNWNGGELIKTPGRFARNEVFLNKNLNFEAMKLPTLRDEVPGNTLSILLSDINNDGLMDLMAGNDYEVPDAFYLNTKDRGYLPISQKSKIIPVTPRLNMTMETADINNDLKLDIYMTGGTYNMGPKAKRAGAFADSEYCHGLTDEKTKAKCEEIWRMSKIAIVSEFKECDEMEGIYNDQQMRDCMVAEKLHTFKWSLDFQCEEIPASYKMYRASCEAIKASLDKEPVNVKNFIPQKELGNILLVNEGTKGFVEKSEDMNVADGAWSWSGKIADLDNDEWQDIYVVNGSVYSAFMGTTTHSPNMFFYNQKGEDFKQAEQEFGLDNWEHSSGFTYIDYDMDGDLDIISNTSFGPAYLYRNNNANNNSITFTMVDEKGNSQCIGCKLYIEYGPDKKKKQVREIKSGGAFLSFDAPVAHFGLGQEKEIKWLGIVWSDGTKMQLPQPIPAGSHYVLTRPN